MNDTPSTIINSDLLVLDTREYWVTQEHNNNDLQPLFFTPKNNDMDGLCKCFRVAYAWGYGWVSEGHAADFTVVYHFDDSTDKVNNRVALIPTALDQGADCVVDDMWDTLSQFQSA